MDIAKIISTRAPGPFQGMGATPHGRPFNGVVEDSHHFWVTWLVSAARAAGIEPAIVRLTWAGVELSVTPVKVGFGTRYYFRCPRCARRCEAVYYIPRAVGCVKCLHLGYRSQVARITSKWRLLNEIFDRPINYLDSRHSIPPATLKMLARGFEAALTADSEPEITISLEGGE